MANSTAILTDAFPPEERGWAMGINGVAAMIGSFVGLILGGVLADVSWRLVFWVNVPFGLFGTIWAYLKLQDSGRRTRSKIDWWGNLTFAIGLIAVLVGITYAIQPYKTHTMAWTRPMVLDCLVGGVVCLLAFVSIELRADQPMFDLSLFKIRAFAAGNLANLLASVGRGGLQFMLIIWLQGVWLPLHGYSFESTPLWAGIYMVPLTLGMLVFGPLAGRWSDRYGARPFATGGMVLGAVSFVLLMALPANFSYPVFAVLLFVAGVGSGLFMAPNTTGIMNAVPAPQRGAASGMRATGMNAGMVLSIGLFLSLMIVGLASTLPHAMQSALLAHGVPLSTAARVAKAPPVGSLFAAFLGFNPMKSLIPAHTLASLPGGQAAVVTGKSFFPTLISAPFMHGLRLAFTLSLVMFLIAAVASWARGPKTHADEDPVHTEVECDRTLRNATMA
jgi:MFS family permease